MTIAREKAITWVLGELDRDVLMGYRGDLRFDRPTRSLLPHGHPFNIWDCSGLMCGAIHAGGGPDMRGTHNAQLLHDGCRELVEGEHFAPGDLAFYGTAIRDPASGVIKVPAHKNVIHVAMWLAGGNCISADGATWGVTVLEVARASKCKVRLHTTAHFRGDYLCVRRNVFLDAVDRVTS